jgi:hypothetical protein
MATGERKTDTVAKTAEKNFIRVESNIIPGVCVKGAYCAVYNLTGRRFVAPFGNLTLLGLMMWRRRRGNDGGNQHGATIQTGVFAIDS